MAKEDLKAIASHILTYRNLESVVSLALITSGGWFGWVVPEMTLNSQECLSLRTEVTNFQDQLVQKGTLGRGDGLSLEVRDPEDIKSLKKLGELKNSRDSVCKDANEEFNEPVPMTGRAAAAVGLLGFLHSLYFIRPRGRSAVN